MTRSSRHLAWATATVGLMAWLSVPAVAHYGLYPSTPAAYATATTSTALAYSRWVAGAANGHMRVGLTLVDAPAATPLPDPASLDFPATSRAIRCESQGARYRECRTPFRGPVTLSREVAAVRCVEDENWGWREGVVWVDRGCAAVFERIGES